MKTLFGWFGFSSLAQIKINFRFICLVESKPIQTRGTVIIHLAK